MVSWISYQKARFSAFCLLVMQLMVASETNPESEQLPKTLFKLPPRSEEHYQWTERLSLAAAWALGFLACLAWSGAHDWFRVLPWCSGTRLVRFGLAGVALVLWEWFRVWKNVDDGMFGIFWIYFMLFVLHQCNRPPSPDRSEAEEEHGEDTTAGAVMEAAEAEPTGTLRQRRVLPPPSSPQQPPPPPQAPRKTELQKTREQIAHAQSATAVFGILSMVLFVTALVYLGKKQGRLRVLARLGYVGPATAVGIGPVVQTLVPSPYGSINVGVSFATLEVQLDPAYLRNDDTNSTACGGRVAIRDRGIFFNNDECLSEIRIPRALLDTPRLMDLLKQEVASVTGCIEKSYPDLVATMATNATTNTSSTKNTTGNDANATKSAPRRDLYEIVADLDRCLGYDGFNDYLDLFDATTQESLAAYDGGFDDAVHGQAYRFGLWAKGSAIVAGANVVFASLFFGHLVLLRHREDELRPRRPSDFEALALREASRLGSSEAGDNPVPLHELNVLLGEDGVPSEAAAALASRGEDTNAEAVVIHTHDGGDNGNEEETLPAIEISSVPPPSA